MTRDDLLRSIATYGLPRGGAPLPTEPLGPATWSSLLRSVRDQRLIGYLASAVEAGDMVVSPEQRDEVFAQHLESCVRAVRLDRTLLALAEQLHAAGIDLVVLKGTASAHLLYPDPAMRVFADNDLLFRTDQFESALRVLQDVGYVRPAAPPRPDFDRLFAKGVTLKGLAGDEVDTHRNLVFGTFGFRIDLDELFDSSVTFELGGRRLRALGPETRFLHACYHAALGDPDPRYSSIRDIAQMLAYSPLDIRRVLELARRWESQAVLARALHLCRDQLGFEITGALAAAVDAYEPTRRERRAIASYVGVNRHYAAKVAASLPYLDGVGTKLAFLRAATLPSEEFVESRGNEPRGAWIRRGVRSLFSGAFR